MTEVLGKNVKMLMDPQHASRHDEYIANYLKTGVAKVGVPFMFSRTNRKPGDRKRATSVCKVEAWHSDQNSSFSNRI